MKPNRRSCSLGASCAPLTMYLSFFKSNCTCAPSSQPKNLQGSKTKKRLFKRFRNSVLEQPHWTAVLIFIKRQSGQTNAAVFSQQSIEVDAKMPQESVASQHLIVAVNTFEQHLFSSYWLFSWLQIFQWYLYYLHVGGLSKAFEISGMLTMTVLIPLPFPST